MGEAERQRENIKNGRGRRRGSRKENYLKNGMEEGEGVRERVKIKMEEGEGE
jgi:hypothetical protein